VVLVLALSAGLLLAHTLWGRPLRIGWFYERVFLGYALDDPELLSRLRVLEPLGIRWHNAELTDASPQHEAQLYAQIKLDQATLRAYERSALDAEAALSFDVLDYFFDLQLRGERFADYDFPINQMFGVQSALPSFLADVHGVANVADAEDYLARLSKVPRKFAQVTEGLVRREQKGLYPPQFAVTKVLAQMRGFRSVAARDNLLYTSFALKLQAIPSERMDPAERERLLDAVADQIEHAVYPAYDALIAHFVELAPKATSNDGIWRLPDGAAYYDYLIEVHTTTRVSAEQLHQTGLNEVARIQAAMDALLRQIGYSDGSVGARMQQLSADPAQHYPDTDAGRAALIADYTTLINDIDRQMAPWFDLRPAVPVEVRAVPAFSQASAPGAYYQAPALDGSRPGVFNVNLRDMAATPRFGMRTLACHEAIPGHHFQMAIAQQLQGLPTFRRVLPFTAFTEGWALYAEQLAWEAGLMAQPLDDLGRLQAELFRAARLVVDTGMHAKHWSRERAIDYLQTTTGMATSEVVAEIERYLVNPGQALAYKVGMLKILQLRERARRELGERFDLRAFHHLVLSAGSLPLQILEQRVEAWIQAQR
jgi:uncharacterized protein (DUF885 family)